ncbi:MAG: hypothetical protein R3C03_11215 [Pirellulaceae bacterium]
MRKLFGLVAVLSLVCGSVFAQEEAVQPSANDVVTETAQTAVEPVAEVPSVVTQDAMPIEAALPVDSVMAVEGTMVSGGCGCGAAAPVVSSGCGCNAAPVVNTGCGCNAPVVNSGCGCNAAPVAAPCNTGCCDPCNSRKVRTRSYKVRNVINFRGRRCGC